MLTDAQGRPIVSEGRYIKITETKTPEGKRMWGVDFGPDISSFEFEEVIMILGDVTRGIAEQALRRVKEAKAMQAVNKTITAIKE